MYRIAIISESKTIPAESFVEAHRMKLSGEVHFLYGGTIPKFRDFGISLAFYPGLFRRILNRLNGKHPGPHHSLLEGLKKYLSRNRIDLVLAEYGTTGAQVYKCCRDLGLPMLIHFHGYDCSVDRVIEAHRELYPDMFSYARYIISVSEEMSEKLVSLGASPEKVILNPYGPASIFRTLQPNYETGAFLAVGRLIDKKAPYLTLMAFQKVHKKEEDARLVIIGDGYLMQTCRNLARELGLTDSVQFIGQLDHAELLNYFRKALCFVQHSIVALNGDMEGTPVAILEAQAAGLPVVSTRHAGIREAVLHEKTGFLVEENDVKGMAGHMLQLYRDRQLAAEMGKAARTHMDQNYTMEDHMAKLEGLIDSILNG